MPRKVLEVSYRDRRRSIAVPDPGVSICAAVAAESRSMRRDPTVASPSIESQRLAGVCPGDLFVADDDPAGKLFPGTTPVADLPARTMISVVGDLSVAAVRAVPPAEVAGRQAQRRSMAELVSAQRANAAAAEERARRPGKARVRVSDEPPPGYE